MNRKTYPDLDRMPSRSAWDRGVKAYAYDLLDSIQDQSVTKANLLNGAHNWKHWATSGSGLAYDSDIAERMCTPSELKRKDGGRLPPNSSESWLDMEAYAAEQAAWWVLHIYGQSKP